MQQGPETRLAIFRERQMHAGSRASFYAFLSGVFGDRPSSPLVRLIRDGSMVGFAEAFPGSRRYAEQLRRIASCIDIHRLLEAVAIEHTRLFVGPGDGYLPPYESIQAKTPVSCARGESAECTAQAPIAPLLWGDAALDAQRCYVEAGFVMSATLDVVPDHISTELDFLRLLCLAEAQAWQDADSGAASRALHRQRTFLNDHLLAWVPGYCCLVEGQSRHPFFAALAALTSDFLYEEADLLNQLQDESLAVTGGNAWAS